VARALLDHLQKLNDKNRSSQQRSEAEADHDGLHHQVGPSNHRESSSRSFDFPILRCGGCRRNESDANEMVARNSQSMKRSGAFPEKARPIALPHQGKTCPLDESALVYVPCQFQQC
jgi:hypothetical protein